MPPAADAFALLAQRRGVFWLDSSAPASAQSRYSMLGCEPRWVFSARDDLWTLEGEAGEIERGTSGALEHLERLLDHERVSAPLDGPDLPFYGGAVGWLSYDLGRQFEKLPRSQRALNTDGVRERGRFSEDHAMPDIRLAWYDAAAVYDHVSNETWLVSCRDNDRALAKLSAALRTGEMLGPQFDLPTSAGGILRNPPAADGADSVSVHDSGVARSNLSAEEYMARVGTVREGIARGEFYQLNLVQRFTSELREPPVHTYLRLRSLNPAPFAAFLAHDDAAVLCSSPERFLEVTPGGLIRTCPIKGTRPRGTTVAEDNRLRDELLSSTKERAELLMIVDLLRNDLGRVCMPGSVAVRRLHALESFATVHHLVGEITGQLRPEVGRRDLLRAVFPGGSITGAPKVSAMRAIEQLEPNRRGIAMGSIGYFSAHGRIDLNIAIRTIVVNRQVAQVSVGAGIVWDSDPAAEYAETLAKARPLFEALRVKPT